MAFFKVALLVIMISAQAHGKFYRTESPYPGANRTGLLGGYDRRGNLFSDTTQNEKYFIMMLLTLAACGFIGIMINLVTCLNKCCTTHRQRQALRIPKPRSNIPYRSTV